MQFIALVTFLIIHSTFEYIWFIVWVPGLHIQHSIPSNILTKLVCHSLDGLQVTAIKLEKIFYIVFSSNMRKNSANKSDVQKWGREYAKRLQESLQVLWFLNGNFILEFLKCSIARQWKVFQLWQFPGCLRPHSTIKMNMKFHLKMI